LGTTYSCIGVWQNDRVEIIANDQGNRTTPSYVAFTDTERLIGDSAKNQVVMNPYNTIFAVKRLIGLSFYDQDVQSDMKVCNIIDILSSYGCFLTWHMVGSVKLMIRLLR